MKRPFADEVLELMRVIDLGDVPEDLDGDLIDDLGEGVEYAEVEEDIEGDAFEAMTKWRW